MSYVVRRIGSFDEFIVWAREVVIGHVSRVGRANFHYRLTGHPAAWEETRVLRWALRRIEAEQRIPDGLELWHDGACGFCRGALRSEFSRRIGLTPDCAVMLMAYDEAKRA